MKNRTPLVAMLLLLSAGAEAHHVWLEQEGERANLYFGEFGMNLHEISAPGGLLNKLSGTSARLIGAGAARDLPLLKEAAAYTTALHAKAGDSIVAEVEGYPLYEQKTEAGSVQTWYRPAARLVSDFKPLAPALPLDIVPTGTENQFAVYFDGKPLPRTAIKVITPAGWTQEIRTNREGLASVTLPWKSWYAIQVSYTDKTPGKRGDEPYGQISHVLTLTLRINEGLAPPPVPPAAAPYIEKT